MKVELRDRLIGALEAPGVDSSDFDLNPFGWRPAVENLRPAAVLIPVTEAGRIILTMRSAKLKHHPGQIAFPGGKVEASDASPVAAALREAHEEIGLDPAQVEVLGCLPFHQTVTSYRVTPVLGMVRGAFVARPDPSEVEDVFEVPVDHIADTANFRIEGRRWQGQKRYYFTAPFGPYYIWGATARILRALAEGLKDDASHR